MAITPAAAAAWSAARWSTPPRPRRRCPPPPTRRSLARPSRSRRPLRPSHPPVALAAGTATSPAISALPVGTFTVTVNFVNSDGNFANSSGGLSGDQVVIKSNTTTTVTPATTNTVFGQPAVLTVTVTANAPGAG